MFTNKYKMVRNPHINANDRKSNANNGFSRHLGLFALYLSATHRPQTRHLAKMAPLERFVEAGELRSTISSDYFDYFDLEN